MNFMGALRTGNSVRKPRPSYQRDESAAVAYISVMWLARFATRNPTMVMLIFQAEKVPELARV
jgi:hypothetical protein